MIPKEPSIPPHEGDRQSRETVYGDRMKPESLRDQIKIAVVDDQKDFRDGLGFLINAAPGLVCVATCSSAQQALQKLPNVSPDVVLLDIDLSDQQTGLDCIRPLKEVLPKAQIVMLTVVEHPKALFRAICLGANGYLRKASSLKDLPQAIRAAYEGASPISPEIARLMLEAFQTASPSTESRECLTPREMQVVQLLAQGLEAKEIAQQLGISPETIKSQKKSLFRKLRVNSSAQAIGKVFPDKPLQAIVREAATGNAP